MGDWLALGIPLTFFFLIWILFFWAVLRLQRRKAADFRELLASGTEAAGSISAAKKYMAKGGAGLSIHYEFKTADGEPRGGRRNLLVSRLPQPSAYAAGAKTPVLYLPSRPAVCLPKDLCEPAIAEAEANAANAVSAMRIFTGFGVVTWVFVLLCTVFKIKS